MKKPARNTAPNKNPTPPNVEKIIKRVEAEMVAIANSPQASENSKPSDSRPWDITPEKMRLALAAVCELCKEKGIPLRKGLEMTRESAGRPIMVSVEFRETPEFWEGYLWRDDDKQTPLFTFSMPIRQAGRPAGEWNPATDTLGVENAKVEFLKFVYPNSSPCCEIQFNSLCFLKATF